MSPSYSTLRSSHRTDRSMRPPRRWTLAVLALALVALWPAPAAADKAAAEHLFLEGKALMDAGRVDEACQKLEASMEMDPAIGALLNLALCHQKQGKTASAWAEFKQAATMARQAGDATREKGALQHATGLESKLSTLTVQTTTEPEGLEITRGATPLAKGSVGERLPVDPGVHEIVARAPGHQPWSAEVTVGPDGDHQRVEIPALLAVPATGSDEPPDSSSTSTLTLAGWVLTGAGVAGLTIATILGLVASDQVDDVESDPALCPNKLCSPEGRAQLDDAEQLADGSTATFLIGGALVVTGAVLLIASASGDDAAPPEQEAMVQLRPVAGPGGGGLWLLGSF